MEEKLIKSLTVQLSNQKIVVPNSSERIKITVQYADNTEKGMYFTGSCSIRNFRERVNEIEFVSLEGKEPLIL